MYHPYLRGKQNELILLRENAKLLATAEMIPIIEPVKKNLAPLEKAINELVKENVNFILIINPRNGDFINNSLPLFTSLIDNILVHYDKYCLGYIVDAESNLIDIKSFLDDNKNRKITFIHNGYPKAKDLGEILNIFDNVIKHIFLDDQILYRRQFNKSNVEKVLIKDGFRKGRNKDYPDVESFSELHLTYKELGLNGFGDFLIVGDEYSETGGPAYAVAIHLTYFNEDEVMYIRHFVSDKNDTPTDPAGKFAEALAKLVKRVEKDNLIFKSDAYRQYKDFHERGHFPGLGVVKKLSMQHHIETLAQFLE
ncbi:sce7725 family protein [Aliarcobacter butzleri]|uniref:sce7725 family protein n=1 Tax=Aliarcobacter butzleri TaxID=28197 RepID=UPI00263DA7FE|nr:sce7725 family protein [Aliarcobacter butzleri]MDN5049706.1 sce7725 family protein [Aliarcobacter butzleri]MDN5056975.1 sce7725 family protein [Aliarcobacter butzleri]